MGIVINIERVEIGKTENWLNIFGYIPRMSSRVEYLFEYCGTELHTSASLTEVDKRELLEMMQKHFGFAPFPTQMGKITELINEGVRFEI